MLQHILLSPQFSPLFPCTSCGKPVPTYRRFSLSTRSDCWLLYVSSCARLAAFTSASVARSAPQWAIWIGLRENLNCPVHTEPPGHPTKIICKQKRVAWPVPCRGKRVFYSRKTSLRLFHLSYDPHQNNRTDKGHHDRADESARVKSQHTEHPSSDNCAENPHDNVHHHAISPALHHFSGEPPGNQSNCNPVNYSFHYNPCSSYWR